MAGAMSTVIKYVYILDGIPRGYVYILDGIPGGTCILDGIPRGYVYTQDNIPGVRYNMRVNICANL